MKQPNPLNVRAPISGWSERFIEAAAAGRMRRRGRRRASAIRVARSLSHRLSSEVEPTFTSWGRAKAGPLKPNGPALVIHPTFVEKQNRRKAETALLAVWAKKSSPARRDPLSSPHDETTVERQDFRLHGQNTISAIALIAKEDTIIPKMYIVVRPAFTGGGKGPVQRLSELAIRHAY